MTRRNFSKVLAGAAAAGMLLCGALPAYAEDNTMTVQYTKGADYVLNIPKTVDLSESDVTEAEIGADSINLASGTKLQVKVASGIAEGKVTLTEISDSTKTTSSTVSLTSGGAGIAVNDVVAEFEGNSTEALAGTGTLYFSALENVQAGSYKGTITFSAEIVNQ